MTSNNDDAAARSALRVHSDTAPQAKFALGQQVFFNVPTKLDPAGLEFGQLVARTYNTTKRGYVYDVDTGAHIWFNVPETELQLVEKI